MESVEDVILGEGVSASGEDIVGDGNTDDHSWVQWYQRSWLDIKEREDGVLVNPETVSKKKQFPQSISKNGPGTVTAIKRGLIRFLYLVIDYSDAMRYQDYKPNRVDFIIAELTNNFIPKFFQENPLSYISIVIMRDGEAHFLTRMNGQPKFQIKKLKEFAIANNPSGSCSIVKAIDLIIKSSVDSPMYASREVLVIWGSLSSADAVDTPISPYLTEKISRESNLALNVVSMSPEVFAIKRLTESALSSFFAVATNQTDFCSRLSSLLLPKTNTAVKPVYIKMGFPVKTTNTSRLVKCLCHKDMQSSVYVCPQCHGFVCEIPTNCPVCKLTLVEKDMLTRVHRLLYNVPSYLEKQGDSGTCFGCDQTFSDDGCVCENCGHEFCTQCSIACHDTLKHCPGCLTSVT